MKEEIDKVLLIDKTISELNKNYGLIEFNFKSHGNPNTATSQQRLLDAFDPEFVLTGIEIKYLSNCLVTQEKIEEFSLNIFNQVDIIQYRRGRYKVKGVIEYIPEEKNKEGRIILGEWFKLHQYTNIKQN